MAFGKTTPILRIFDEAKAKEFYVDFLRLQSRLGASFRSGLTAIYANLERWLHHPLIRASWRLQSWRGNQD